MCKYKRIRYPYDTTIRSFMPSEFFSIHSYIFFIQWGTLLASCLLLIFFLVVVFVIYSVECSKKHIKTGNETRYPYRLKSIRKEDSLLSPVYNIHYNKHIAEEEQQQQTKIQQHYYTNNNGSKVVY